MIHFSQFTSNLKEVEGRIANACELSERDRSTVSLLPVTKNHPVEAVRFCEEVGLLAVGENRVQEAVQKRANFEKTVKWELIGHLQSNKSMLALETFDRVQSVDSLKILSRLNHQAGSIGRILPILLQFNTGEDPNKYGFQASEGKGVLEAALSCEHLRVDGLMTIAPLDKDSDVAKATFARLRDLRDRLADNFGVGLEELSMGMTGDLEHAIEAGSTQIRVGSALFGARSY